MSDLMEWQIDGYEVTTAPDGIISISPALYGERAQAVLRRYPHLDEAVARRRAAVGQRDREVARAASALAEAARERRQAEADARVAACRRHRATRERTQCWSGCVVRGACDGAAHGAVTETEYCRCGAERDTETNGRRRASSGWYGPAV